MNRSDTLQVKNGEEYWRHRLSGDFELSRLPGQRLPESDHARWEAIEFSLPELVSHNVQGVTNGSDYGIFMILLSGIHDLLTRYTGQAKTVVGVPRMGAVREDVKPYPLLFCMEATAGLRVKDWFNQAKQVLQEAIQHQSYPLHLLEGGVSDLPVWVTYEPFHQEVLRDRCELNFHFVKDSESIRCRLNYDANRFAESFLSQAIRHLLNFYELALADTDVCLADIDVLTSEEKRVLLREGNRADLPFRATAVHRLFEEQASKHPDRVAVVYRNQSLTYRELNEKANRLAGQLQRVGTGVGAVVGLYLEKSIESLIAMLGVWKAGGCYLPLDPGYPPERIQYMLDDSGAKVVLTQRHLQTPPAFSGECIAVDAAQDEASGEAFDAEPVAHTDVAVGPEEPAYLIYTSGSTGKPKGVKVRHQNLAHFCAAMKEQLEPQTDDVFLSVTSISFDITILEMIWPLTQGLQVVLHPSDAMHLTDFDRYVKREAPAKMDFSVFFFSSYDNRQQDDKYRLLLDTVKFADQNGFAAVWTPERHFHEFGGLYPNPSVTSAALAMVTERLRIRSGSLVSPLHSSIRIAEEWAVVDNFSGGRAEIAFASGWHVDDFVLMPENYEKRKSHMFQQIEEVNRLWQGHAIEVENSLGKKVAVKTYPRPIQAELPVWVTTGGNPETFAQAGRIGANLLTHLLGQNLEELEANIALYRKTLAENGFAPDSRKVSIMLHTFIGTDLEEVRAIVKEPFCQYLRSSLGLIKNLADRLQREFDETEDAFEELLEVAFERYWQSSALLGTRESVQPLIEKLSRLGIDEIACLLDFGVSHQAVMESLTHLKELKDSIDSSREEVALHDPVTLFQCTPSRMRMMVEDRSSRSFLASLRKVLIGGEPFPSDLGEELAQITWADILNLYGPTETTIWSSVHQVKPDDPMISIGHPLGENRLYILDSFRRPLPSGVTGEIYIGGSGVAGGYWQREALTSERFVQDPFSPDPAARMYRTGDLGRYLPDGSIEYVGRIDQQVKINGYRMELGEIEAALLSHPSIEQAVVVKREDAYGGAHLVAYFTSGENVQVEPLKAYLETKLPAFMQPAIWMQLDEMPLTPNGKIDRKALPDQKQQPEATRLSAEPQTPLESKLVEIWKAILGVQRIGVYDNFFQLGGHSLKAMLVVSKINRELNLYVPLMELFQHPTISELAGVIDRAEKRNFSPIPWGQPKEFYPLSSVQRRMFILSQIEGANLSYNTPYMWRITGPLDRERLEAGLQAIVDRHEILRTSFLVQEGTPVQRVHDDVEFQLGFRVIEEAEIFEAVTELIQPFDVKKPPLLRAALLQIRPEEHVFFIDLHHIASDGESVNMMVQELNALYRGEKVSPVHLQYRDFAQWQQTKEYQDELDKHRKFWLESFAGELPILQFPTDHPRPAQQQYDGDILRFEADEQVTAKVHQLGEDSGTTLFMILLAAYNVLLSKYSGQDDIIVGSLTSGRNHPDIENIPGMFVNTLPLRNHLRPDQTFRAFLAEVKGNSLRAYEHQNYSFEHLVEEIKVRRDISRNPLFDTLLVLQNLESKSMDLQGLRCESLSFNRKTSKFDFSLTAAEHEGRLHFTFEYCTHLFEEKTMGRLARHFLRILDEVVANPEQPIHAIDMRTEQDLQTLQAINDTACEYPRDLTLHQLFEAQVEKKANEVALVCEDRRYTYHELNQRVNRVAHHLRSLGVGADHIVGLMVERSEEMIIGMLGILKAGGAYLPIDPKLPPERVAYMLADSQARWLLSRSELASGLSFTGERIDVADVQKGQEGDLPMPNPPCQSDASDLAYLIYTSGSTGLPKGVAIEHRAVVNFMTGVLQRVPLQAYKTLLAVTTISFDIHVLETLLALTHGLKVVLATEHEQNHPRALSHLMKMHEVDVLQMTPSRLQLLFGAEQGDCLQACKVILVGGEKMSPELLKQLASSTSARLYNMYGPTEATVWVAIQELQAGEDIRIGKPLANTEFYVLGSQGELQPDGIPGELCIAGDSLARGYHNRPELTAEKFAPHPMVPEKRLYRTGDLVKQHADGSLTFIGRLDDQVKVRGYRIELGEIEAKLLEHPAIREAVVRVLDDSEGIASLCAYLVSETDVPPAEIKTHLAGALPDYMIPSAYVYLEHFPLSANGKVDRKHLPLPSEVETVTQESEAPINELEELLVQLWARLFDREHVSRHDDFFALGGHSFLAVRMELELEMELAARGAFLQEVMIFQELFKHPTIKAFAAYLRTVIQEGVPAE